MPTKIFVTELVNAFNLNNYFSDNIYTNFTVQGGTKGKNDKIVSSFGCDGNIKKYLKEVREEIINRHYGTEEAADGFYNLNCFPFVFDVGFNKKGKFINKNVKVVELANLMDGEVIRNLKLHFVNEFQERVEARATGYLEEMARMTEEEALKCVRRSVQLERTDRSSPYLYCISFGDRYFKEKGNQNPSKLLGIFKDIYVKAFNSRLEECGFNNSSIFYEQRDNKLYIKDITDINVIKDIVRYVKERIAFDFKTPGNIDSKVENCKDAINDLIFKITGKFIEGYEYDVFTNKDKIKSGHSFALIPLVEVNGQVVPLSEEDAYKIKKKFYEILGDVVFSNIKGETKDELGQISSSQGPVYAFSNKQIALLLPKIMESPIAYNQINGHFEFAVNLENFRSRHGLLSPEPPRTPPNQRKKDTDSGYDSNSPPKPKDSVAHSSSGGPSSGLTELSSPTQEFPKRSRGKGLEKHPRRRSKKEEETEPFRGMLGEIDSSQSTCGQSQLSLGAGEGMLTEDNIPDQKRSSSIPSPRAWKNSMSLNSGVSEDSLKDTENIYNEEPEKQQVTKEKEEEKLFKALLYWFNLNNYALDPPHTNFIVKNGKIASLIDDGVDVKEYLQEIIDKTKEEYRVNKEEAYDFNEFPFQFLSHCEKNQKTTVVANISRGALLNLKELFSREHEGKVEIKDIDINIVEKAVKSEKDKWVSFQVREHRLFPKAAIKTCYPDESVLEYISITKDKGGYWINRTYDASEVKSFREERWPVEGKSKAEKMKSEDNKDSGISSAEATDAENVSSKAEATTSGYESIGCENTGERSPKRTLELSVGMEELTISTDLYATKAEQHSPIKKFRSN
ncbi:hypothetical protein [Wolbachia endosymbiont (group A) of Epistrophe grossularia]|uniref:hypothetical protein n=1 Tax=Wolbachia endosymbiont (group A) of Epistrophe grossularia TaxID=2954008 RepID=UPI002230DB90|nr:hypothetical protein [Wolbachia endosymbiont (group A) of Epistrophe grossularia]